PHPHSLILLRDRRRSMSTHFPYPTLFRSNMLRFADGKTVTRDDIRAFATWAENGGRNPREISYRPARVLMQDFTGVPAVVDLAAARKSTRLNSSHGKISYAVICLKKKIVQ